MHAPLAQHIDRRMDTLEPGIYTADSDTNGYGTLTAIEAMGAGEFLGERYLKNGVRSICVNVTGERKARRNPEIAMSPGEGGGSFVGAIGIGEDYYTSALREYGEGHNGNWQWAQIRELAQNSVDAGATEIHFDIVDKPDGTQVVSCDDDGKGMDQSTIQDKFLMLGATGKKGETSATGGFGKAKELLILPWISWKIESLGIAIEGRNSGYSGKTVKARVGTKLTVIMPSDRKTTVASAIAVLHRSHIPNVRFYVNGDRVYTDLRVDEDDMIDSFSESSDIRMYYHKARRRKNERGDLEYEEGRHGIYVRKNGLFMFEKYLPESVPGYIVCEVLAPSLQVFNTSRMDFNSWTLRRAVERYVSTLSKDVRSAIKKKKKQFHKVWEGEMAKARPEGELAALMMQNLGAADAIDDRKKVGELAQIFNEAVGAETAAQENADADEEAGGFTQQRTAPVGRAMPELVEDFLSMAMPAKGEGGKSARHVEMAIKQVTYLPSFYIHGEDWVPPKKITPDGDPMMPTLRKMARFWTECCRLILIRMGFGGEYGVGWIFEHEPDGTYTAGETMTGPEDKKYLLLNPFRGGDVEAGEFYSLRNEEDLDVIWSIAVHECVHLASGIGGHDEDYSSALTDALAKTSRAHRLLTKIRDRVVRRPPGWKPAPKAAKTIRFGDRIPGQSYGTHDIESEIKSFLRGIRRHNGTETGYIGPLGDKWYVMPVGYSSPYGYEISYREGGGDRQTISTIPASDEASKTMERRLREIISATRPEWVAS